MANKLKMITKLIILIRNKIKIKTYINLEDMNFNENYIFSLKNMMEYTKNLPRESVFKEEKKQKIMVNDNRFYPNHVDKLFWCLYVILYGLDEYKMIAPHYFEKEQTTKFHLIEEIRSKKDQLKANQFKLINNIELDLANNKAISLHTFMAVLCIRNKNITYVEEKKIFDSIRDEEDIRFILHKKDTNVENYELELNCEQSKIDLLKKKLISIPTYHYKLKAVSSYTSDELKEMCEKLKIDLNNQKKILKKDMYEKIKVFF